MLIGLNSVRFLVVGSSRDWAESLIGELRRSDFDPEFTLVGDEGSIVEVLASKDWDLILVNDDLADLSVKSAVSSIHCADGDLPAVVVCSRDNEEEAIAAMEAGGRDYILREDLRRLGPVVRRELADASIRRDQEGIERALAASEARFRAIVEDQTEFVVRWKPDGARTFVNRAYCEYFQGSFSTFIGKSFFGDIPSAHRGFVEEILAALTPENPVVVAEPRVPRPNGDVVYHEWVNRGVFDARGELVEIQSVGRDVTKQYTANQAERQQRLLVEVLRDTAAAINTTLDLDEVFDRILANIGWVIPHNASAIFFVEEGAARVVRLRGWDERGIRSIPEHVPLTATEMDTLSGMMMSGQPIVIQDTHRDDRWQPGTRRLDWVRSFAAAPLFDESKLFGVLALFCLKPDYFTNTHLELLEGFASQAATASRNARLFETVSESRRELRRLSIKIVEAQEEERRRISQELHDGVAQTMTAVIINAELLLAQVAAVEDDPLASRLREVASLAKEALKQTRNLSHRLRPAMLDELGLVPTLRWFTQRFAAWAGVEVEFSATGIDDERLEPAIETGLYRVVQEALTNVVRHAEASRVKVELIRETDRVVVRIEDDGEGFDPKVESGSDGHLPGIGLIGLKERVISLGGVFTARSCDGGGVRVDVEIPFTDPAM